MQAFPFFRQVLLLPPYPPPPTSPTPHLTPPDQHQRHHLNAQVYINIVMEYCDAGDLTQLIKGRKGALMREDEIMFLFVQVGPRGFACGGVMSKEGSAAALSSADRRAAPGTCTEHTTAAYNCNNPDLPGPAARARARYLAPGSEAIQRE